MSLTKYKFIRVGVEDNFLPGGRKQVSCGQPLWKIEENHKWW